ncbi:MAG: hypothetical protein KKA31_01520, partial [Candidatus Margulisbacteria bacterium]|nr:hypothetical protein [Candidatus Margulisiibacteriota bacterium]
MAEPRAIHPLKAHRNRGQQYKPPHGRRGWEKPFPSGFPIIGNHALELKGPSLEEGLRLLELKRGTGFRVFKDFYLLHQSRFESAFKRIGTSIEGLTGYSFLLCVYEGLNTLGTTMPQADLSLRLDVLFKHWGISQKQGNLLQQPQIDLLYKIGAANIARQTLKLFLQALLPLLTRVLKPAEAASEKVVKNLSEGSNFDFLLLGLQNITSLYQRQIERIEKQIEEERQAQAAAAKKCAEEKEEERTQAVRLIKVRIAEAILELSFTGKELTDVKIASAAPEHLDLEVLAILAEVGRIIRQSQAKETAKTAEPIRKSAEKILVEANIPLVEAEKEQQELLAASATELTHVYDGKVKKAFITFDSFIQKVVTGLKLLPQAVVKQLSGQSQKAKEEVIALAYRLGTIVEKLSKQANNALAEYLKTTDQATEVKVFDKPENIEHFETGLKFVVKKPRDFTQIETVIAYGKLFHETKEATQTRDIDKLTKTIKRDVSESEFSGAAVVKQALVETGAGAIPSLLAAKISISRNPIDTTEVIDRATQF